MHIKKYLKLPIQYNRNIGFVWKYGGVVRKLGIIHLLIPALLIPVAVVVTFTHLPDIRLAAFKFSKPKPITQSAQVLPSNIQIALENLAKQEIKVDQSVANVAVNTANNTSVQSGSLIQPLIDSVQELITTNPSEKAKIEIRRTDRLISGLQTLLTGSQSDQAINQAVSLIQNIGDETQKIATNPQVQTDREILQLQIEQYNRLQLTLQKLEDNLPIQAYLKIEDARQKFLVVTAIASINAAPNLDAVHNIAVKEVAKMVGSDFAELKAIEIVSDFEAGIKPESKQKLAGLEKQLAQDFEKRMLKLPANVRNKKLQDYIKYSFGSPLKQAESFERMKSFLNDREIILGVESLKELALQKLENRVFEIKDQSTLNQFLDQSFKSPLDLKILAQMKMDVLAGKDVSRKAAITTLEQNSLNKVVEAFGKAENLAAFFNQDASASADLLDVSLVTQLSDTLNKSSVPSDVKNTIKNIKQKTIQDFAKSIQKSNFVTQEKLGYNPVSSNADVRLLLPAPQAITLLESVKGEVDGVVLAEKAEANILKDHLLTQVKDPQIFEQYQEYIVGNSAVKQALQNYVGQSFLTDLNKKDQLIKSEAKKDEQALYEKIQQIEQQIFVTPDGQKTDAEKNLPEDIQKAVEDLKTKLPEKEIPKLDIPAGVILPEVAKLPDDVSQAIVQVAKDQIKEGSKSKEVKLDLSVQAKDLGVSEPTILPGNILYPVIEVIRDIKLVVTLDPVQRAQELIKQDNEKTLEAGKLMEGSASQTTIDLALKTLSSVQSDFDKLKANSDKLKTLEQTQPQKVDQLVDQIIENGVARQTVFASIEGKVHGDEFVAVEKVRSEILKDGVDTLLQLTDNNVQKLTSKLEAAVAKETGSELKDIKAVELLVEIARTQPEQTQQILQKSESNLAQNLENKLLEMPKEQRVEKVLDYAQSESGNPVRQFEAADVLKDNFKNPETILLTEGIKDKAVENLTERVSEITDATSRAQFVDQVVGDKPQDLKIAVEIETRVAVPANVQVETTPIVEKIKEIKAEVEQNIIDTYKDKPQELAKTDLFNNTTPDVGDIKAAQDLTSALERSPEVIPEVVAVAKQEEVKVVDKFVKEISSTKVTAAILSPVPETVAELVDLKNQLPAADQAKIDIAIKAEVNLIEQHITTQVNDQVTLQTYQAQITQDPVVAQVVAQVGGTQFTQSLEQKAQAVEQTAVKEQQQLTQEVAQVTKEVFSNSGQVSAAEASLPVAVQQKVEEIKKEVPVEQVQVTVSVSTPTPPTVPEPVAPAPVPVAPAPAAPAVESKPAEPAAPAVPSL